MSCLSDLVLDELVRGELADPEAARRHLKECARCAGRLQQIEAARAEFARPKRRLGWIAAVSGLAAAAGLILFLRASPEGERLKGGPQLTLFVRHDDKVRPAGPREPVAPGDTLQFTYQSDRARHLAVLSLDGAGHASIYFPDGAEAAPIRAGRDLPLPRSTVLDAVLGPESLYGLFCDGPIALAPLRAQLERERKLPPVEGCSVIALSIEKK